MLPNLRRVYPGWYIAAAGAATNVVVMGFILVGFGIFIRPMREELGWSVAAIAAGYSVRSFEQGSYPRSRAIWLIGWAPVAWRWPV